MIETYRGMVFPHQEDHMGHMNVMWYTSKFDEATWHLFAKLGVTPSYVKKTNCGMAALEIKTNYLAEVTAGTLLVVRSKMMEATHKVVKFRHTMFDAETDVAVATCELTGVHLHLGKRKSLPFPDDIQEKCQELLAKN